MVLLLMHVRILRLAGWSAVTVLLAMAFSIVVEVAGASAPLGSANAQRTSGTVLDTEDPVPGGQLNSRVFGMPGLYRPTPTPAPTPIPTEPAPPQVASDRAPTNVETFAPPVDADLSASLFEDAEIADDQVALLYALIARARADAGRAPLTWHPALAEAAMIQARDMAACGVVRHTGSDGSTVSDRLLRMGYAPRYRGELIAWVPAGAEMAFDWWWRSSIHHTTMLGPSYRDIGIARVEHPTRVGHSYFVVVLGKE